jgi:hypothetical protein
MTGALLETRSLPIEDQSRLAVLQLAPHAPQLRNPPGSFG